MLDALAIDALTLFVSRVDAGAHKEYQQLTCWNPSWMQNRTAVFVSGPVSSSGFVVNAAHSSAALSAAPRASDTGIYRLCGAGFERTLRSLSSVAGAEGRLFSSVPRWRVFT
jgi:hypothetical protein